MYNMILTVNNLMSIHLNRKDSKPNKCYKQRLSLGGRIMDNTHFCLLIFLYFLRLLPTPTGQSTLI